MINSSEVLEFLLQEDIPVSGSIIKEPGEQNHYYVFISIERDGDNRQQPSNRKLNQIRSDLLKSGVSVEFLLTDVQTRDIEAGLRATLLHAFGDVIRNAFLTVDNETAYVWLDQKKSLDESIMRSIQERVELYLNQFSITSISLSSITKENLPSILLCLKIIRILAPVDTETLGSELTKRDFSIPSKDWLKRRLDTMRRSGKVVRLDDGNYVLSLESIRNLGSGKGSNSPDIFRMLALARRS